MSCPNAAVDVAPSPRQVAPPVPNVHVGRELPRLMLAKLGVVGQDSAEIPLETAPNCMVQDAVGPVLDG